MREYYITWKIELSASNPREAAKEALDSVVNGTARVFEVSPVVAPGVSDLSARVLIDLDEKE